MSGRGCTLRCLETYFRGRWSWTCWRDKVPLLPEMMRRRGAEGVGVLEGYVGNEVGVGE